jgi:multidrug transporter EmrE-like cation transporter
MIENMMENMEIINNRTPEQRFYKVISFALFIVTIELISQISLKHGEYPIIGIIGYIVIAITLLKVYEYENMGHMILVWSSLSIIFGFILSHLLFGERINYYTLLAIIFSFLAIYTAHLSDEV